MTDEIVLRPFRPEDGPDGPADIAQARENRNADSREVHGSSDYDVSLEDIREAWRETPDHRVLGVAADRAGELVGSASGSLATEAGAATAYVNVRVRAGERRHGIGSRLLAAIERDVAAAGRGVFLAWTEHREVASERLTARSGWGSIPLDGSASFALVHGYVLEQVHRNSRLDIAEGVASVRALLDAARAASSPAYAFEWWETPTAPDRRDDLAVLHARMSTDAPSAGLEEDESIWDAARVERWESSSQAGGNRQIVGAARHLESGRLVAFNDLTIPPGMTTAHQNDTLVLSEHRGHRLGMLVKCETLLRLHEAFPHLTHIETHNAEENRPMLDINEAMGFRPVLYAGVWQKKVPL